MPYGTGIVGRRLWRNIAAPASSGSERPVIRVQSDSEQTDMGIEIMFDMRSKPGNEAGNHASAGGEMPRRDMHRHTRLLNKGTSWTAAGSRRQDRLEAEEDVEHRPRVHQQNTWLNRRLPFTPRPNP